MKHLRPKLAIITTLLALSLFVSIQFSLATTQGSSSASKPTSKDTLRNGLMGWWTFDGADVTAVTTTDKSGTGNNGTRVSGTKIINGKIGQAMKFDGVGSYIDLGSSATLNQQGALTLSGWFKLNGDYTTAQALIVSSISGFTTNYALTFGFTDNKLELWHTGAGPDVTSNRSITDNLWHFFVVTRSGSSGNWKVNIYIDGVLDKAGTTANNPNDTVSAAVAIGRFGGYSPSYRFNGSMDDMRVYNRALSATEITALYQYGQTKINSSQTAVPSSKNNLKNGLVGWWTMDGQDTNATQILDKSGNYNTSTLISGVTKTAGKIGQATKYNGGNYFSFPAMNNLRSVSFWIYYPSQINNTGYLVDMRTGLSNGYIFHTADSWTFGADWSDNVYINGVKNTKGTFSLPSSRWTHVYLEAVSNWNSGTDSELFTRFGASSLGQSVNGNLDDVRVYNRALSASEIQELYKSGGGTVASSLQNTPTSKNNLKTGLVGWWTMDGQDVTAVTTTDKSSTGANVSRKGGISVVAGKIGQALNFNGTTGYVSTTNVFSFNSSSVDHTYSAWVYERASTAAYNWIINNGSNSTGSNLIIGGVGGNCASGVIGFFYGGGTAVTCGTTVLTTNAWHHVVTVYSSSTNKVAFYLDGIANGTSAALGSWAVSAAPVVLGRWGANDSFYFNGKIDDVRIYNRALSQAEITELYKLGK